jgi:cell division septum initiation protein DivIVA
MQIPKEILSEKNYTGNRRILVEDPNLMEFQTILEGYQKEINPLLDTLNKEYSPVVDPLNQEVLKKLTEVKELKAKIAEETAKYKDIMETIDSFEQRADLIKNKVQPIVLKALEGQLGEFEVARYTEVQDGKIYAVVFDEIEEKVKELRANKAKK